MRGIFISALASLALARPVAAQPERGVRTNAPIVIQRKMALVIGNQAYSPALSSIPSTTPPQWRRRSVTSISMR